MSAEVSGSLPPRLVLPGVVSRLTRFCESVESTEQSGRDSGENVSAGDQGDDELASPGTLASVRIRVQDRQSGLVVFVLLNVHPELPTTRMCLTSCLSFSEEQFVNEERTPSERGLVFFCWSSVFHPPRFRFLCMLCSPLFLLQRALFTACHAATNHGNALGPWLALLISAIVRLALLPATP